jgi:competence protein ComEC
MVQKKNRRVLLTWQRRAIGCGLVFFALISAMALHLEAAHIPVLARESSLRVWVFDVGQGDAILIEAPTGEQMLVDAGPSDTVLAKLGAVLSPLDRSLDAILVTHPHEDHLAGFVEVLRRYDVETVYETGDEHGAGAQSVFWDEVALEGASHTFVQDGVSITLGDVTLDVMAPDASLAGKHLQDPNLASVVLLLTYGETSLLFMGDAPTELEEEILPDLSESVDVLKVAHHGSAYSTSQTFLEVAEPRIAIISVGKNSYGHPHPVLLSRLKASGADVYRTDVDGDILITSFGREPTVQAHSLPF